MWVINVVGLLFIGLIIWWFWLYKPVAAVDLKNENISIVVNNGIYQPSRIKVVADQKTTLKFIRKDGSLCAATVIFPAIELSAELPLDKEKSIALPALSVGEYAFHCPMKMYSGTLIVE